jgi:hypothetical protein
MRQVEAEESSARKDTHVMARVNIKSLEKGNKNNEKGRTKKEEPNGDNNATENADGHEQDGSCLKQNCRASSIQSSRPGERKRRRNMSLTEAPCQ